MLTYLHELTTQNIIQTGAVSFAISQKVTINILCVWAGRVGKKCPGRKKIKKSISRVGRLLGTQEYKSRQATFI